MKMNTGTWMICATCLMMGISACSKDDGNDNDGQNPQSGLAIVNGSYLADACGDRVVLRGVNMGAVYATNFGSTELEEIAKTGANSVRLVLSKQFQDWSHGGVWADLKAAQIEPLITSCLDKSMIPVLELHDYTGSNNTLTDLPKAVSWWTSADIKTMLLKYQGSIILNIANEPDDGSSHITSYNTANGIAIKDLRNAGYTCPLMIDAPNWGKDETFFVQDGQGLMDNDPLHNLIFSVHAYWPTIGAFGNYSDAQISASLANLKNTGLPIVIGELARADIQNGQAYSINYPLLMKLCQENGFGYLAWWWGFTNPGSNNELSMTPTGLYTGLSGAGSIIAISDPNSIQKTSARACGLK